MENREIIFKKIEAKEKEWDAQVKYLRIKAAEFDSGTRVKIEEQIDILNSKLNVIKDRTNKLKETSSEIQQDLGEKILHSWIEVFTKIDDAMLRLKK